MEQDVAPKPETWDDVCLLYPNIRNETTMVSGADEISVRDMIAESKEIKAKVKKLEQRGDDIKNAIGILIGENAVLTSADGDVLARRSEMCRENVSIKNLVMYDKELVEKLRAEGIITTSVSKVVKY